MGNGAIFATIAVIGATMLLLFNTQLNSQETGRRELAQQANQVARELAMTGRKLVLADWVESNGTNTSAPFTDVDREGGHINVSSYTSASNMLDFTVRASYDSVMHEVRSRFRWSNVSLNAMQFKVGDITPTISPAAQLNFTDIALDNSSLLELESILVNDLGQIGSLSEIGLGFTNQETILQNELNASGNGTINIEMIDETYRSTYSDQDGVLYPDQISQTIELFEVSHPSLAMTVANLSGLNGSFGIGSGPGASKEMLTVSGNLTLGSDFEGQGILVVEGNLIVPDGINFNWDGVVLIRPPESNQTPVINFDGNVNINGSLVALHDMPNVGHMDLSVYRDMSGVWSSPTGADVEDSDILEHTHDYTSLQGNYVVYHSDDPLQPNHESYTRFNQTLGYIPSTDSVFFEIYNSGAHGFGLISVDLTTSTEPVGQTVAAGFDDLIKDPVNPYRTVPFKISDIENFDIRILRLSSLKKMWDVPGVNYPGCFTDSGPQCVWHDYNRQGALTMRLYNHNTGAKVYAASLYWHKRADEQEEFEDEMSDLMTTIQSSNYGLNLTIGDNATITSDIGALLSLGAFSGPGSGFGTLGVEHLGTWHRQWDRHDPNNPLLQVVSP